MNQVKELIRGNLVIIIFVKCSIVFPVLKRTVWKDKFEITYVGPSQVLVKPLDTNERGVILRSQHGGEIDDVKIMGRDSYLVAKTRETLLVADLLRNLLSEVHI